MHMLSKNDLNSAALDTVRVSRRPTTVITATGSIETNEEAIVCVRDLDLFVTRQFLNDTPPVLSLGKLCEDHGYVAWWTGCQEPHLVKEGRKYFATRTIAFLKLLHFSQTQTPTQVQHVNQCKNWP